VLQTVVLKWKGEAKSFFKTLLGFVPIFPGDSSKASCRSHAALEAMFKVTVSPDFKCLEVISIKSPQLRHVTPDIKRFFKVFLKAYYTKHIPIILFNGT
jgi:hypothetical protein